jgi:Protein of unknown function (DUF2959)
MPDIRPRSRVICLSVVTMLLIGCQSAYYAVWEKMGKEKRHLLHDQVENSRIDQQRASDAFKDALTRLKEMYGFQGGDLEKMYSRLSDDYDNCNQRAETIDGRIEKIRRIAQDLFAEWRQEIDQIHNPAFRSQSAQKLRATQLRFASLEAALMTARKRMTPVLANLKDYVLYLKHNLNAQAIGSLKGEASSIETDVDRLVRDIQRSIREADAFLKEIEK